MLLKPLTAIAGASALIIMTGAASAQSQCAAGGGIWSAYCNSHAGKGAKSKSTREKAQPNADAGANANSTDADANASAAGTAKADENGAALGAAAGATAAATASAGGTGLAGLATGQSVKTSGGESLGTVSKIVKASDGSVSQVIVTSASGKSFPLSASKLSMSGGVVIAADSSEQ